MVERAPALTGPGPGQLLDDGIRTRHRVVHLHSAGAATLLGPAPCLATGATCLASTSDNGQLLFARGIADRGLVSVRTAVPHPGTAAPGGSPSSGGHPLRGRSPGLAQPSESGAYTVRPPSTGKHTPVTKSLSSKNSTAPAMCSGLPSR